MVDCRTGSDWAPADAEASVGAVGNIEMVSESPVNQSTQALQAFNDEINQFYARKDGSSGSPGHEMATILKSQFPSLKSTTGGFNVLEMNFWGA